MHSSAAVVDDEHGVDALLRITAERPGEVSIVAIGPLTNIATAVVKDREFAGRVKSLYVMGGSNNGRGNITASAEYNFYVDPEAAQIVMDAGFTDLHLITWDPLTLRDATIARADFDRLGAIDTPLARFFHRMCAATLDYDESVGIDGSTHPDSLTIAALLHPELVLADAPVPRGCRDGVCPHPRLLGDGLGQVRRRSQRDGRGGSGRRSLLRAARGRAAHSDAAQRPHRRSVAAQGRRRSRAGPSGHPQGGMPIQRGSVTMELRQGAASLCRVRGSPGRRSRRPAGA